MILEHRRPPADPKWTPAQEAAFFNSLDSEHPLYITRAFSPRRRPRASAPEALLRDFAVTTLGAKRCGAAYLEALRHVLGAQAEADKTGEEIRLSTTDGFANPDVLRSLIDQFNRADVTYRRAAKTSASHSQVMTFYRGQAGSRPSLEALLRRIEQAAYLRWTKAGGPPIQPCKGEAVTLAGWAVPY